MMLKIIIMIKLEKENKESLLVLFYRDMERLIIILFKFLVYYMVIFLL